MKTLYLDCGMGAAGDMLSAALLELHPEPEQFVKRLNPPWDTESGISCRTGGEMWHYRNAHDSESRWHGRSKHRSP